MNANSSTVDSIQLHVDTFSTKSSQSFELDLPHFEMIQNLSYFGFQWHHVYHCLDEYQITVTSSNHGDELNLKYMMKAPDLKALFETDNMDVSRIDTNLLAVALENGISFPQCTVFTIYIEPSFSNAEDSTNSSKFEHTVMYFTYSVPPNGLKMVNKDSNFFDIVWDREDCYESYMITFSNSTYSWNETIKNDGENKSLAVNDLQACTKYNIKIWSMSSEKGLSEDHSYLTVYTEHPEEIHITNDTSYNDIHFNVSLHGTDCLTHYLFRLCDNDIEDEENCISQPVNGNQSNLEFHNLTDGKTYSYELVGYDSSNSTVFNSERQQIKTPRIVTVKLELLETTNITIKLELISNIFEDNTVDNIIDMSVLISCTDKRTNSTMNVTFSQTVEHAIFEVDPYSYYNCLGVLTFENEDYKSNALDILTEDGIPSEPLSLELISATPTEAVLKWNSPSVLNGESISDYLVDISPLCEIDNEENEYCETKCSDSFSLHTNKTTIIIHDLIPFHSYGIKVSAKTKHPTYGPSTNENFIIKTLPAKPKSPHLDKIFETFEGNVEIDFYPECPLTGNTSFKAGWNCHSTEENHGDSCTNSIDDVHMLQDGQKIQIKGLEGGHSYDLFILATVKDCWKEKEGDCVTQSNIETFFKEGIPSHPIALSLSSISPNTALVKWKEPSTLNGDSILDYLIEVIPICQKEKDACGEICESKFSFHTKDTFLNITGLSSYSAYDIKVSAKTKHPTYGPNNEEELIIKTPPSKPNPAQIESIYETLGGKIVIEFRQGCPITGNMAFEAMWNCLEEDEKKALCKENNNKMEQNLLEFKDGKGKVEIENLQGGVFYDFFVVAMVNECDYEDANRCTTKSKPSKLFKDGVPSKPRNLNLVNVSPSEASIKWEHPKHINGEKIIDYLVEVVPGCKPKDEHSYCESICRKSFILHTNETQMIVDKLQSYSTYEINVSAKTRYPKYGLTTEDLVVSTPPSKPHKPRIIKTHQTSGGTLMVHFKHSCPLTGVTDFEIDWKCQSESKESVCKNVTNVKQYLHGNDKIEVVGLDGGHFYDLTVLAKVKNCWTKEGTKCETASKSEIVFLGNQIVLVSYIASKLLE